MNNKGYGLMTAALAERARQGVHTDCKCRPYDDVMPLPCWNKAGYQVKAGEHAIKHSCWTPFKERKDEETGEEPKTRLRMNTSYCFCRCQTQPRKQRRTTN